MGSRGGKRFRGALNKRRGAACLEGSDLQTNMPLLSREFASGWHLKLRRSLELRVIFPCVVAILSVASQLSSSGLLQSHCRCAMPLYQVAAEINIASLAIACHISHLEGGEERPEPLQLQCTGEIDFEWENESSHFQYTRKVTESERQRSRFYDATGSF